ncbi:hypothetical protein Tco_1195837 [Tanacetum coccineum]
MVVQVQAEIGKGSANPTDPHHTPTIIQPSTCKPQKKQKPRKPKRKDTQIPQSSAPTDNVADEAVNEEINNSGGLRCQETMGDTIAQTRSENVSKLSNDPLLARGNTLRSDEDSLKLNKLMPLCTNLQQRVLDLETIKTTQTNEIASLKKRVKKLERRNKSRTHGLKRMYRVGSSIRVESFEDEVIPVSATTTTTTTTATITDVEITLAQALAELKSVKPKAVKVVIQEPEQAKKAKEKRNRPPTRAQQRSIMCTYLKNMEGWKPKILKNKSFANIQELFDKAMKRVNTFLDYRTELVEESSKKAETKLEENSKKAESEIA